MKHNFKIVLFGCFLAFGLRTGRADPPIVLLRGVNLFDWQDRGMLLSLSGQASDAFGQVTPFLHVDSETIKLYFGAAARQTWDGNAIAVANVTLP
jgi:hypothetical protein